MFDIDRWKEIISALKKNRMRSLLTAFGVFWGIFMLIIMAGVGRGFENGMFEGVGQVAQNSFFMWSNRTSEPYMGLRRGRWWTFDNEDVEFIKNNIHEADIVAPRIFAGGGAGNNTIRGDRAASFYIKGDYPEWNNIDPADVLNGRWLNEVDILQRRKVCVVGEQIIKELFDANENPIGEYIKINGVFYQIVGVIKPVSNINMNGRTEESIFIPFSTMQVAYNYGNDVHVLGVTAKPGYSAAFVEEKVIAVLKQRHKIAPTDVQAISHINLEKQFKQFSTMFDGIRILTWIVGLGTLLAGVIGVSNIMLVIVRERTQEIGIMRAIGATPRKVIGQIMLESVFITAVAGYIGMFVGILLLEGLNYVLEMAAANGGEGIFIKNPDVNLAVAVSCLLVLIVSGAIAGYIPARKAVAIKTIDALRAE
ncbi:MAG TPA: ABC transporter permease [Prolixibacteraceae bacterium]|nr:ABC transporter permease [Prolixibacteraceae bacterium]HPR59944.1 ABC transporter permease [Prolixibacteraceae bacterium]